MADPVSALGTAVGVVSLGLQVYGGFKSYLKSVKSRKEHIAKTLDHLNRFKESIDSIDRAMKILELSNLPVDTVLVNLKTCQNRMQSLSDQLRIYELSPATDIKGKMRGISTKLSYGRHHKELFELEKSLENFATTLSLAIQGLNLCSNASIDSVTKAIRDTQHTQSSSIKVIDTKLDVIQTSNEAALIQLGDFRTAADDRFTALRAQIDATRNEILTQLVTQNKTQRESNAEIMDSLNDFATLVMTHLNISHSTAINSHLMLSRRLAAKPSLLSDTIALLKAENPTVAPLSSQPPVGSDAKNPPAEPLPSQSLVEFERKSLSGWRCTCSRMPRRRTRQTSKHLAYLSLYSNEDTMYRHAPECRLYRAENVTWRRTWGISFTALRRILRTAIFIEYTFSYGAGGYSISPSVRYHPMVDESQSPAFRILSLAYEGFRVLNNERVQFDQSEYISNVASSVREVFANKKASPLDINNQGMTLIDYSMQLDRNFMQLRKLDTYVCLSMTSLLELGVLLEAQTAISYTISRDRPRVWYYQDLAPNQVAILRTALRENPEYIHGRSIESIECLRYSFIMARVPELASVLELDALCEALMRRDEGLLHQALANQSQIPKNIAQYPFKKLLIELSMGWPTGLEILLQHSEDLVEYLAGTGIETAIVAACDIPWSSLCQPYTVSEPLRILLEHKCHLTEEKVGIIVRDAPMVVISVFLQHLKEWREKLKDLLSKSLPEAEHRQYTQDARVLDIGAPQAIALLERHGIFPHIKFNLKPGDFRLSPRPDLAGPRSIYHNITMNVASDVVEEVAQEAFELGFLDVDAVSSGRTPLMNAYQFGHCDAYIDWLLTHGADATRLYTWATFKGRLLAEPPVIPRHTVLHRLCRLYGHMGFFTEMLLPVVSSTKRNLMADGCACVCTDQARDTHRGCSPLSVLLNHLLQRCGSYSHTTSEILDFFGRVQEFAEDAIRCLTFRRLHIRHTCCISLSVSEWEENELPYDYGSDFEELRGEDSERIHLLENLMVEFTEKYRTCGLTLREFLFGPWMQRMRAIEREHKNDLSNFEKDKISAIGVRMVEDTNDSGNRSDWEDSDELEDSASVGDIEDEEDLENGKGDPEDLSLGGHVISDSISSSGHFITFSDGKCMNIARPEHWYAQFEIIANGGRSRFEGWRLRPLLGRFPGNRP